MTKLTSILVLVCVFNLGVLSQVLYNYDTSVDISQYKTYNFPNWQEETDLLPHSIECVSHNEAFPNKANIKINLNCL